MPEDGQQPPDSGPQEQKRNNHRVPIAAQCEVHIWRIRHVAGDLTEPSKHKMTTSTPLDLSVGGIGFALAKPDQERLRLQSSEPIAILIDGGSERFVCAGHVRHITPNDEGGAKIGISFAFDTTKASDRRTRNRVESVVAELNRAHLRRRAIYGPEKNSA